MTSDILIDSALLLTMTGRGTGPIVDGSVAIANNRIAWVGPAAELPAQFRRAHRVIDGRSLVALPGLIDGHVHTSLSLLRGTAQDMDHWMQTGLAPFAQHLLPSDGAPASSLAALEAVTAGTTTLNDFSLPNDAVLNAYDRLGIRVRFAALINELPARLGDVPPGELYQFDPAAGQDLLLRGLDLLSRWQGAAGGRITCQLGPQGPDMLSRELLLETKAHAISLGAGLHMHVAQGDRETEQLRLRYGKRSIPWLSELGYLDGNLLAAHLTDATGDETAWAASKGVRLACCPGSIAIIDGIVTPAVEFSAAGGRVALGSDQAPGNNCTNMWNEMKLVCLLNKVRFRDPTVMPAHAALRWATVDAARAIGLGDDLGTLEPGKLADVILVDLLSPGLVPRLDDPVRNVVPNLVYSARGHEVVTVLIDGRVVVDDRALVTGDAAEIVARAQAAASDLSRRARPDVRPAHGPARFTRDGLM